MEQIQIEGNIRMNMTTVKELRLRKGMTQMELSKALGVAFNTVNRWENGVTKMSDLLRYRAAAYFGVDPDTIKGGVNEPPPER